MLLSSLLRLSIQIVCPEYEGVSHPVYIHNYDTVLTNNIHMHAYTYWE